MSEQAFEDALESLVDKGGIRGTLEALASICYGKAEHIRHNWQDEMTARAWEMEGKTLERALQTAKKLGL